MHDSDHLFAGGGEWDPLAYYEEGEKKKNLFAATALCAAPSLGSWLPEPFLHLNLLNNKLFSDLIPKTVANISGNKQPTCLATGAVPSPTCF